MRPLRIAPIAVAGLLLATGLVGVSAPLASAGSTHEAVGPATVHPSAGITVYSTNSGGGIRNSFYTGYSEGTVYFEVFDAVDSKVTVHINDNNASRDGLTNPVFSYTANTTSGVNESYLYGVDYLIPLDLVYGGWWNITADGTTAGFSAYDFYVNTYYPTLGFTASQYLPGQTVTGVFEVLGYPNDAPYSHATVTVAGEYTTNTSLVLPLFSPAKTFGVSSTGNFSFTIPANASTRSFGDVWIWANATAPAINQTEETASDFAIGNLSTPQLTLSACAWGCGSTSAFVSGQTAFLNIQEWVVGYGTTAAPGMDVAIAFRSGSSSVSVPGAPTTLTTNATGGGEIAFNASSAVFSTTATNEINVTVSDPSDAGLGTFVAHIFFTVTTVGTVAPVLALSLNGQQYYGGDTVTVTWEMGGLSATATQGWSVGRWYAYEENSADQTIAWGFLNSSAVTGSFSFVAPLSFGGTIYIYLQAYNASETTSTYTYAYVTAPTILLNPSEAYYLPGDTVTVGVTTMGSVFAATTLFATVTEPSGNRLLSGTLSGSSFQFTIPTTATPTYVTFSVAAQSSTDGIVAAATQSIDEGSGLQLEVGVNTKSNYADGSFQPGQTIQISYALIAVGQTTTLPRNMFVYVYPGSTNYYGSEYGAIQMETTSTSGTISYTIPSSTPSGDQTFTVYADAVICTSSCGAANQFSVYVEPNPSVLGMDLGAGSGLTVGWLILLVIIIVVAILLLLVMRRRGGRSMGPEPVRPYGGTTSSGSSSMSRPPSSSSEMPSGAGDGGADSSPPPMPSPPGQ